MPTPPERTVRHIVELCLDPLLVALVALRGTGGVEVPAEALDLAIRSDSQYQQARGAFRTVFEGPCEVLRRDALFFELEKKRSAAVSAATDVGFRLGLAIAVKAKE